MAADLLWFRPYLVKGMIVFPWDVDEEEFGTPVAARTADEYTNEPELQTDKKRVFGANEHFLSYLLGGKITMTNLGLDFRMEAVIAPVTYTAIHDTGTGEYRNISVETGDNFQYFGAMVNLLADEGRCIWVGFPRCKLMTLPGVEVSGEFSAPEVEIEYGRLRLSDDTLLNAEWRRGWSIEQALPTTAELVNTFFGLGA